MWLTIIIKYWRWVAYAAGVVALVWLLLLIRHWHQDSVQLPAVREQVLQEKKKGEEEVKRMRTAWAAAQSASEGYQHELETIRNTPVPVNTVIRVCKPAPRVSSPGAGAAGPSPTTPATGVLYETLDLDTRPLFGDAARCDALSAQVRGLLAIK